MEADPDSDNRIKKEAKIRSDYLSAKSKISIEYILIAVFVFLVVNIIAFGYVSYSNLAGLGFLFFKWHLKNER